MSDSVLSMFKLVTNYQSFHLLWGDVSASKVKYHFEDDDCMTIDNANDGSDSDDVAPAAARLSASSGSEDIDRPVAVADVLFPTGTSVSR